MEALTIYQHDERAQFRFQLSGPLDAQSARELECSWQTALSILGRKELVVDVGGLTEVDDAGRKLLNRMKDGGARIVEAAGGGKGNKPGCVLPVARRLLCWVFPTACGTD
ncbi:STAS domain-containing protein [uncultured Paludibaculum sp.]|uniref:STAS domain-containing protein n=1 Tax=uncultured Paludibaculum sp. TaxID=1765020 RepID=UPI002AAC2099|nr:hypothetical protein [uncultured Paludibaculum sp.]